MSYELYVTGGYGFTETILPRLLYPSNAVDVARDYFTRGYQGHHIDLPPDADFSQSGNLTDTQKRKLLDDLQDGRLVLASRYGPGFELFTESEASPDLLRSDLPPALRHRLQQHWATGARGAFARSDSLAPAVEPANPAPEPPVAETPSPGSGPYHVKLAYRWPDGTGVANLPFTLSTDQETVKGTLDAHGEAQIQGLNGRFATVRLSSDASDGDVSQQRRGIQAALEGLLKQERKEAEDLTREYEQLPWYRRGLVSVGAVSQGFSDAGMGLIRFVAGVSDLSSPTQAMLDGLKSAWAASEGSSDEHWFESYQANYEEARHRRWVEDLGFDPSDISREDIADAYDLANLVMADPELRQSVTDFAADYAAIQHHTEVSYFTGAVAFDVILTAILAVATGGVGAAGAAGTQIRHAGRLTHLGKTVKAFGKAVRKQRLRRIWRDADLNSQTVLEDTAPSRVDGLELKATDSVPDTTKLKPKQGTLRGEPELPHPNANADMVRSLTRQNESAELLANRGLDVTHLPNSGRKGGNPDLDIGGRSADVYSPKSKNPNTIWDNMTHKVEHQAPDIVLNLTDSPLVPADMLKFLQEKPVDGLENLYLIKDEEVLLIRY
ncbi:hypothetical protein [Marinobacter sp. NFXS9]|uniref:CdiA C-terminal domain-containing protein n=1 Tax=Marinobacter sp. NFXS9 TaxID=2818433 RepID=UPI0032DED217